MDKKIMLIPIMMTTFFSLEGCKYSDSIEDGVLTEKFVSSEDCRFLNDQTFLSVETHEVGLGSDGLEVLGRWFFNFTENEFSWQYSDIGESGAYQCDNGEMLISTFSDATNLLDLQIDSGAGKITLNSIVYEIVTGPNIAEKVELQRSVDTWLALKTENNSNYEYSSRYNSWIGFGSEITLEVENDILVARHRDMWDDEDNHTYWSETTPDDLGSHDYHQMSTIDQLYAICKDEVLVKDPVKNSINLSFDDDGILKACTYFPNNCQDDCSVGVNISSVEFK